MINLIEYLINNKDINVKVEKVEAKKNQTLFLEGDECKSIGIILYGKINIVSFFADGKEIVYNSLSKGEMFGNNLIFSSTPFFRGDVVSIENSEIAFISKNDLLKAMNENVDLLEAFLNYQSDFSKTLNFKIKLLTIDNARDRVEYYLTFNKGTIKYQSITKLAKELYLSRESLSRTVSKMQADGEIEIKEKAITLKQ